MKIADLRSFVTALEEKRDLVRVRRQVDPKFELASVVMKSESVDGPALLFENVKGYETPVVSGLLSNMRRAAVALSTTPDQLMFKISEAMEKPLKPIVVTKGPVKENVVTQNINLLKLFPIPHHAEMDAGPFITAGVTISKDPDTGRRNLSYHRMQVKGPSKCGFNLAMWRHTTEFYEKSEGRGEPLEAAVCIGLDPAIELAAAAKIPYDELEMAGALRGEPIELVRCETVDIEVPAHAEIVIEGRSPPKVREKEAPFAEFLGYYGGATDSPIFEVSAVCYRDHPIYRTIVGSSKEHVSLGNVFSTEPRLYQFVKQAVPTVKMVHLTPQSGGFHAVISIEQKHEGEARNAIIAALASYRNIKHVVVVDEDIDIFNPQEVEWAIATRVQGDEDIMMTPRLRHIGADPSSREGLSTKTGIDATRPLDSPPGTFMRADYHLEKIKLKEYLSQ